MKHSTWHIAGIGAMGGLIASQFSDSGQSVRLILKTADQLALYQKTQLTVNQITCHPDAIDIEHLSDEPIHYLICTVKAYDVTPLLMRLNHRFTANSLIILIHNGLGVLDEIKQQLPHLRIICGISTLGAYLEGPFSIRAFLEGKLYLGDVLQTITPEEINTIVKSFQKASLPVEWDGSISIRMLEKFAINCSINLLTVLFTCKNGALREHDLIFKPLTHEIAEVLNCYGLHLTGMELLTKVDEILQKTADNYSSMVQDVLHHRPTELPYLNEHFVRLAAKQSIQTPITNALLQQYQTNHDH